MFFFFFLGGKKKKVDFISICQADHCFYDMYKVKNLGKPLVLNLNTL